jgi:glucan-binding YG repeat protein/lysophospholipase L1-like esterase
MIDFNDYIYDRGNGLANTFAKLNNGEKINVLYMGGSVTNGTGASERELTSWRGIIGNWLAHNAGKGKVKNVNAAYGDTCSLFGAYRLNAEILPEEPDLIFVEFAINDMYNSSKRGYDKKDSAMQYETIIRGIRKAYPDCDIVTILITERGTLNPDGLQEYAQIQENLAIAYDIPSIHLGRALAKEIKLRGKSWSDYSGDSAHPNDLGYSVYAGPIKAYLDAELKANGENTTVTNHKLPTMVSDKLLDGDVQFIDANDDLIKASEELGGTGFAYGAGATNLANSGTNVFKGGVFSKNEEDVLAVKFTGTELAMIEYQPITGFSVSIDGGEYFTIRRDTVRPIVLATNLAYGEHIVRIKPIFSAQSASFHVQGFFARNQEAATVKGVCNHVWGEFKANGDATCETLGTETRTCSECGIIETRDAEGVVTGHIYDAKGFCTACGIYQVLEPTLVKIDGVWYYFENGVKTDATTVVKYNGTWYYVKDGIKNTATTLCKYNGTWYYISKGKIDFKATTVVKYKDTWYYVKNGKKNTATTLCKYNGTWYYINKGKIDFKATTLCKYDGKYYYVKKGKVDFKATTLVKYKGTWYYVKSGKKSTATTLCKYNGKYYYVKSGKKNTATTIVKYNSKKYYVKKGIAQTSFTGKVKINGKTYTVKKGIVK